MNSLGSWLELQQTFSLLIRTTFRALRMHFVFNILLPPDIKGLKNFGWVIRELLTQSSHLYNLKTWKTLMEEYYF